MKLAFLIIIVLLTLIVFSGALFIYLFYADVYFWFRAKKIRNTTMPSEPCKDVDSFLSKLLEASVKMINSGRKVAFPILTADTFVKRAKLYWKPKRDLVIDYENLFNYEWSEEGWLLNAMIEIEVCIDYIKTIFDEKIMYRPFKEVCQCQSGMIALRLYEKTKAPKYKDYVDKMFIWLMSQDTELGILFVPNDKFQLVDVIGMVIPFLVRYDALFHNPKAIAIAEKTLSRYIEYGCDYKTGLPAFSFQVTAPNIKCGAANWGRGCSWFVIGLSYIDIEHLDSKCQFVIKTLESTLVEQWKTDGWYGQFIGRGARDLSAELPIIYYLYKKRLIDLNEQQILSYSLMCHNGIMYYSSSGNRGLIPYGRPYGHSVLSQAYMVRIINLYKERNSNNE